jgi:hypothetical protein
LFALAENRAGIFNPEMLRAFAPFLFATVAVACADPVSDAPALQSAEPTVQTNAPVDQLIPWLLSED